MTHRRFKEIHDYDWFPDAWRRGMTDFLSCFATWFFQYDPVFPLIAGMMQKSGLCKLRDLCSGGSGYLLSLLDYLYKNDIAASGVELTDKYPNLDAFERIAGRSGGAVGYLASSVDALNPPFDGPELRLMFSAMHHFSPDELETIINRARKDNCAIGLFDYSCRDPFRAIPLFILLIPHIFIMMPFTGPFSWGKMFWTYIIPAIPLALLTDSIISRWNGYSPEELKAIIDKFPDSAYEWECGSKLNFLRTGKVVYLTGCPRR
jgi:hypothetical protein